MDKNHQAAKLTGEFAMSNVNIIDHPLIQHKLTFIRDKNTSSKDFRALLGEIAMLMGYEVTRDLPLEDMQIETPVGPATTKVITGKKLAVIPILRAGLGMIDGLLSLVPSARVGHIGLYRDPETLMPVEYYCKLPSDAEDRILIVVDPMLATGGSASAALTFLKQRGCSQIKLMCLIAAPEGIAAVQQAHSDVDIYVAAVDEKLNDHAYIVPGLGDAGDRLFGTK
jgi:uracil phosphoribosyltransferase